MTLRTAVLPLLLGALATLSAACRKEPAAPKTDKPAAVKPAPRPMAPPKAVVLYTVVRSPAATIDSALALVREFGSLPFTRAGLLDLFAQRAHLPRELIEAVDIDKPVWGVGLDESMVKSDPDPMVMVLPLRSRAKFEKGLAAKLVVDKKEGPLTLYKPKAGAVGTQPVRLRITETHAWAASSVKAYELAAPFVEQSLLGRKPEHDITLHVAVQNILRARGDALDRAVDRAMDEMRSKARRSGQVDSKPVASAAEKSVRRLLEALRSTRDLQLNMDLDSEQLTLGLRAQAQDKGRLRQLIKRQRPADPLGYALLPGDSWLVAADHGNPESLAEDQNAFRPYLKAMLKDLGAAEQEPLLAATAKAAALFTGDFTMAVHRAPGQGSGMTLSMVSGVKEGQGGPRVVSELASALGRWIKAAMAQTKEQRPKGMKVAQRSFSHGGATGTVFELDLKIPPAKRDQIDRVIGLPLTLGVAFVKDRALFTLGKHARKQLELLCSGVAQGKVAGSLAQNAAFERARKAGEQRVGLLYVSVVDLLRWFEGSGFKELETIAGALKHTQVSAAPSLDWGVNQDRSAMDITLRLPVAHFRPFKPILQELKRRGAGSLRGSSGGGWKTF